MFKIKQQTNVDGAGFTRKKISSVNPNGWMSKIQKFSFGIDIKTYTGLCPLFWMSVLALIFSPIALLAKTAWSGLCFVAGRLSKISDKWNLPSLSGKTTAAPEFKPSSKLLVKLNEYLKFEGLASARWRASLTYGGCLFDELTQWLEDNPDWQKTHLPQAQIEMQALKKEWEESRKIRERKEISRKALIAKLTTVTRMIFKVVVPLVIGGVLFLMGWGFYVAAATFHLWVLPALTALAVLAVIILTLFALYIAASSSRVHGLILAVGRFIGAGFSFLGQLITMTYKAECPMIEWEDEKEKQ